MKRLAKKIQLNDCTKYIGRYGDLTLAICAYYADIRIGSSLDDKGRQRFHNWDPKTHYYGPLNHNLLNHDHHDKKIGKECCSLETVSFHYIKTEEMYAIHANRTYLKDLLT